MNYVTKCLTMGQNTKWLIWGRNFGLVHLLNMEDTDIKLPEKLQRYAPTKENLTFFEHQSALISVRISVIQHQTASIRINQYQHQ